MNGLWPNQYRKATVLGALAALGCAPSPAPAPTPSPTPAFTVSWVGCSPWTLREGEGSDQAEVQICATDYANIIGNSNAAPDGVIVARMINRGPGVEKRWGLVPGVEYFIAVNRGGRYNIIELGNASPGRPRPNRTGDYYACPGHIHQASSNAKFTTCGSWTHLPGADGAPVGLGAIGSGPSAPSLNSFSGPAWITCDAGCCTTGQN